jgi:hypothetical protein
LINGDDAVADELLMAMCLGCFDFRDIFFAATKPIIVNLNQQLSMAIAHHSKHENVDKGKKKKKKKTNVDDLVRRAASASELTLIDRHRLRQLMLPSTIFVGDHRRFVGKIAITNRTTVRRVDHLEARHVTR